MYQLQVEAQSAIGSDNIGHKLLQKMGWKEGKGIGAKEDGRTAPVAATGPGGAASAAAAAAGMRQDTLGLGAQAHGAVEANDDPFEQYRKRMMLGYK
jgi:splicing factor 4